ITKTGSGKWVLTGANSYTGVTAVKAGTLELGSAARTPVLSGAGGADVQGRLVLDYPGASNVAAVNALVTGQASNFTTGQIRNSAGTASRALSVFDTGTSVDVAPTLYGDANLDYKVNALDFNALASNYGTGTLWMQGNFNYTGTVDTSDFTLLSQNFNQSITPAAPALSPALGSLVPEPASLGLLGTLAVIGLRRRRNNSIC